MIRITSSALAIAVFACIAVATPVAADTPGSEQLLKTVYNIDRSFTYSCDGGFDVVERLIGTETIRQFKNRQVNYTDIRGTITNSVSGAYIREMQHFKLVFSKDKITFKGKLHIWYLPDGPVKQTGVRVYDIESGQLIRSHGRNDPYPNLCWALS